MSCSNLLTILAIAVSLLAAFTQSLPVTLKVNGGSGDQDGVIVSHLGKDSLQPLPELPKHWQQSLDYRCECPATFRLYKAPAGMADIPGLVTMSRIVESVCLSERPRVSRNYSQELPEDFCSTPDNKCGTVRQTVFLPELKPGRNGTGAAGGVRWRRLRLGVGCRDRYSKAILHRTRVPPPARTPVYPLPTEYFEGTTSSPVP